jgi:hypothetical protein
MLSQRCGFDTETATPQRETCGHPSPAISGREPLDPPDGAGSGELATLRDWLAHLHHRVTDRIAHGAVRRALRGHAWLELQIEAGWPTFCLCGELPPGCPDAYCCGKHYQEAMGAALRDLGRPGALLSSLTGAPMNLGGRGR